MEEKGKEEFSMKVIPRLLELLKNFKEIELENVDIEAGDIELWIQPFLKAAAPRAIPTPPIAKPTKIVEVEFTRPTRVYPGQVAEVRLGATKADGGSRSKSFLIGGEKVPPFYRFEMSMPHPPVIAYDVFDMKIPLAKSVKKYYQDVLEDPVAWAKLCVNKFEADMITIHLVSTDPLLKDTPAKESAKVVEDILQAVDVPIAVGAAGVPEKDPEVLEKVAEVSEGERIILNSASLDTDYKRIANAAKRYGHVLIAFTSIDINNQKKLNQELLDILPKDQIIIDPTTAALGYGLEYSFSIMERIRLAALLGDSVLQMPIASGTTNAWAAREAWMKNPAWGPREFRGPLWETITALALLLVGCDYYMMMHPAAVKTLKDVIKALTSEKRGNPEKIAHWVSAKI